MIKLPPYDFPDRVASPERARRELKRLEASYGAACNRRDMRAAAYLARRIGRLAPHLRDARARARIDRDPSTLED